MVLILIFCLVFEKYVDNKIIAFITVKETKALEELFSQCSISIFAAFI